MPVKKKEKKPAPVNYDPKIMEELLGQPSISKYVVGMKPETLDWYKFLLVREGVYARYVKQRSSKPALGVE